MKIKERQEPHSTVLDRTRKIPTKEEQKKALAEYIEALREMGIILPPYTIEDRERAQGI